RIEREQRDFAAGAVNFGFEPPFVSCFYCCYRFVIAAPSVIKLAEFGMGSCQADVLAKTRRQRTMLGIVVERKRAIEMRSPICDIPCMQQGQTHGAMPKHQRSRRALLFCEGQELDRKLAHHVAVERYKVRDPQAVKNGKQQQWIFGRLSE